MTLQRLEVYREFMKLPDQQDLAAILHVDPSTYSGYLKGKRRPRSLLAVAKMLGVSLDWLVGWSAEPMWEPRVRSLRGPLRDLARTNSGPHLDLLERCTLIIREIQKCMPDLDEKPWFLPGLLFLSESAFKELMENPETEMVGDQVFHRLALFTAIPEAWFMHGEARLLQHTDLGEYASFISEVANRGITPHEATAALGALQRHVEAKRSLG